MAPTLETYIKKSEELSTISPVAVELINKVNDLNVSRDEIAKLIAKDDVIFANVFKYVNSAAVAVVRRPKDILEALEIIGMFEVSNLVFLVAAKKTFVDLELWHQSVFMAICSERIAKELNLSSSQASDCYISGLMYSLGELVFKSFYADRYEKIHSESTDWTEKEEALKKEFDCSSIDLSYEIVKSYMLPENIESIFSTQRAGSNSDKFTQMNAILEISKQLSLENESEIIEAGVAVNLLDQELLEKFNIKRSIFTGKLLEEIIEAKGFYSI